MVEYSEELSSHMRPDDRVVAYLPFAHEESGCLGSSSGPNGFIAITEKSVIFQGVTSGHTNGSDSVIVETTIVPISKVSSMSVSRTSVESGGCLGGTTNLYLLKVNVQGVIYEFDVGTEGNAAKALVRTFLDASE